MLNQNNPMIVQTDKTILIETQNQLYEEVRDEVSKFAELEKSPEYIHTYKITPLSLWNAASSGMSCEDVKKILYKYSKYDIAQNVLVDIEDIILRYGKIKLLSKNGNLIIKCEDKYILKEISSNKSLSKYILRNMSPNGLEIKKEYRGEIKNKLLKLGFPIEDLAGYISGANYNIDLKERTSTGEELNLRNYQKDACEIFYANGSEKGGSGVIVLPCGSGKTITAMACMSKVKTETLIITTNITALRQWKNELIDKTNILPDDIGEYSGEIKEIKPITITTYQILTHRKSRDESFIHFKIFNDKKWGFIIYDEVHMLPAPIFRVTSEIQAIRRLGLTATLVREDGMEDDVFSLIGPKKYDVPWKVMENNGWIAEAKCLEIRVQMPESIKMKYAISSSRNKFRIASENIKKKEVIYNLLKKHNEDNVLIIGQYVNQLEDFAREKKFSLITGKTKSIQRNKLFNDFKNGDIKVLVVSKVANFAVDLPDANVAIQISGTFGSRQEEAQRLGRILRPKSGDNKAYFYSIVTTQSREQDFASKRQMFLTEQGYKYYIENYEQ
ncbi:MAG: DNA repair helicase XPB [Clostridiales bacterium]